MLIDYTAVGSHTRGFYLQSVARLNVSEVRDSNCEALHIKKKLARYSRVPYGLGVIIQQEDN